MKAGILIMAMLFVFSAKAQMPKTDPLTWTVEAKKTGANTYDVILHVKMKPTWHVWATNPGGDGLQVAPEFKVVSSTKLNDKVKEKGKLIIANMDGVDGKVRYFENSVDYVQSVTANAGSKVLGSYKYQVCNDEMCLPPKTKKFEVTLK